MDLRLEMRLTLLHTGLLEGASMQGRAARAEDDPVESAKILFHEPEDGLHVLFARHIRTLDPDLATDLLDVAQCPHRLPDRVVKRTIPLEIGGPRLFFGKSRPPREHQSRPTL